MLWPCVRPSVCPSVSESVTSRISNETAEQLICFLHGGFSTYPTLCCKEIQMSTEIRVLLLSGTLSQTPDFRKISPRHIARRDVLST